VSAAPEGEVQAFATPEAWEAWLAEHHATSPGLWLKLAKKQSGIPSVTYEEALEVALCYGWIDGRKDRFDDEWWLQRFTPRRPRSKWSKINRTRALGLIESGRMQPAGLHEVEKAKADGRWEAAYDPPSKLTVPEDLEQALAQNEKARVFFAALDRTNRYAILYRVLDAKRPETRARRIAEFVAMLAEQRKPYP
jgi:uncharacterized protein YdeI (YjbR/CyaY-like superfamily)